MNSNNNLIIKECVSDTEWDRFVFQSVNKNFYSLSDMLNLENNKKYFVYKQKEKIASFCLIIQGKKIVLPKHLIYTPINYKYFKNSKKASINSHQFIVNEAIQKFLVKNFSEINISFDMYTSDLRAFSWFGFPDYKEKFLTNVRYTLISDIKNLSINNFEKKEIYTDSSETNRREIRNSLKKKYLFKELFSKEIFFKLKEKSYSLHNKKINLDYYQKIFKSFEILHEKKLIKMYVGFESGNPFSMTLFGIINDKAIFLHSGRNEKGDNKNLYGVYQIFNSILQLSKLGVEKIDFEGINSPRNSVSKMKFGGEVTPYYSLKLVN
tara:strand:- start:2538 stop:3506 length:969 start_codon:yes stop_codon:yes gene_type:complete